MLKNNLSRILGERRLRISELEKLCDISRSTLTRIYHDNITAISLKTLENLCKALECTPNDIFEYIPDKN